MDESEPSFNGSSTNGSSPDRPSTCHIPGGGAGDGLQTQQFLAPTFDDGYSAPTLAGTTSSTPAGTAALPGGMAPPLAPAPRVTVAPPLSPPPTPVPPRQPPRVRPARPSTGRPRARGPRRAKLQLRHINPWTVLKFSCVLSVALFFVWLITIGLLYAVLQAAGVIDNINNAVTTINDNAHAPVTPGLVFGGSAIIGVINMVLFIALSTVGSVVYNLCADLVGGIEVTLSERE